MVAELPKIVGRYALFDEIASGGMATVHLGRLLGAAGFSRTVAIKRLHPQFAKDPDFVDMFVDEARLAARVRHPNVVPTLDVVQTEGELFLVMEYVQGESLSQLSRHARREGKTLALPMVITIACGVLHGLHAAHNARGERGEPLGIVHRDVSPHNILVGVDGVSRVFDFGVAKARGRLQTTREGQIKGKLAYMAPEQLRGEPVGPETDVYAAGVVLWEAITGQRLFDAETEVALLKQVLDADVAPPSSVRPSLAESLDSIVMKALAVDRGERFESAREMALALERTGLGASATELAEWVEEQAAQTLATRAARVADIESKSKILELGTTDRDSIADMSGPGSETAERATTTSTAVTVASGRLEDPRAPRRRSWLVPTLAVGLVVAGGAAAFVVVGGTTGATASGLSSSSMGVPTELPLPATSEPSGDPPEGSVDGPESTGSASSTADAAPSVAPTPLPTPAAVPRPAVPPPPSPNSDCADPFYVDASGIKRIKPACR